MSHGGQGFALARLLTLGRGVVCINEKSRNTADCLLYSETQKDPRNPRVGLAGRSYPESGSGSAVARIQSPARRVEFSNAGHEKALSSLRQRTAESSKLRERGYRQRHVSTAVFCTDF
jgi:hypothetical protein